MRPTVLTARCRPARANSCAIRTLPIAGNDNFSSWTRWSTKSGYRLTGRTTWIKAAVPFSSTRLSQPAIVAALIKKAWAACCSFQPRQALS